MKYLQANLTVESERLRCAGNYSFTAINNLNYKTYFEVFRLLSHKLHATSGIIYAKLSNELLTY